jgi:hypothetical protein
MTEVKLVVPAISRAPAAVDLPPSPPTPQGGVPAVKPAVVSEAEALSRLFLSTVKS